MKIPTVRILLRRSLALAALLGVLLAPVGMALHARSLCALPMHGHAAAPMSSSEHGFPHHREAPCCDICFGVCCGSLTAPEPLVATVAVEPVLRDIAIPVSRPTEVRPSDSLPHAPQLALPPPQRLSV